MPTLQWVPVPGYPYEANALGQVRRDGGRAGYGFDDGKGYRRVQWTRKPAADQQRWLPVHRLIALAFHGHPGPVGNRVGQWTVNHKNGNKADNRPENLEWCSPTDNMRHAFSTGLLAPRRGEAAPRARLTKAQIDEMRATWAAGGASQSAIAARFGVSQSHVSKVLNGARWTE